MRQLSLVRPTAAVLDAAVAVVGVQAAWWTVADLFLRNASPQPMEVLPQLWMSGYSTSVPCPC